MKSLFHLLGGVPPGVIFVVFVCLIVASVMKMGEDEDGGNKQSSGRLDCVR